MPKASIDLELYGPGNEVIKTLSRVIVPWGILKKAVRLSKSIAKAGDELDESTLDECAALVVEIFGEDNVTVDQLNQYADTADMLNIIRAIANRARGFVPNAPPAA